MFGKYDVYTTVESIYCYRGTKILRNKLGLKDDATLKEAENELVSVRQYALIMNPVKGRFSKNHLYSIHRYLFCDIYSFAGRTRLEQISKGSTTFYPPAVIDKELKKTFDFIKSSHQLTDFKDEEFFDALARVMADLNFIHPFREGNGRAIREFIRTLALHNGYLIDWSRVEHDDILKASVLSVDDYRALIPILTAVSERF